MPISQSTVVLSGGGRAIQLTVPFGIPQQPDSGKTFQPRVAHLTVTVETTGGTLLGNKIYCYFLVALENGLRSKPSRTIEVLIPPGTNTNKITIAGENPFDPEAVQYEVYRSEDDVWRQRRILAPTAIPVPFTFTDTGLADENILPSDDNYAGARIYWRRQGDTFWNLGAETSDKTQTSLTFPLPYNQQGLVIELQLRALTRNGEETPPVVAPTTTFALTAVPQQIDLDIGAVDGPTFGRIRNAYVDGSRRPVALRRIASDLLADDAAKHVEVTSHIGGLGVAAISLEDKATDGASRKARTAAHSSYRPLSNPLTATDAGATATVNIAAFTQRAAGVDISLNAGSISTLSFDTLYFIYYDDASFAGGSVTYNATTVKEAALNGSGRFFVGSIRTPKDGAGDTVGNNDGGSGAQYGMNGISQPTEDAVISGGGAALPIDAYDGNRTTGAQLAVFATATKEHQWRKFAPVAFAVALVLKIESDASFVDGGGSIQGRLRYSLNGGSSWTNIYDVSTDRSKQVDSVVLPIGQNLWNVRVEALSLASGGGGDSATLNVWEMWVEIGL